MRNTDLSPTQWWGLTEIERPWVEVQPFLEDRGYQLRPRYRQGWQPSWSEDATLSEIVQAHDSLRMRVGTIHLPLDNELNDSTAWRQHP